MSTSTIENFIAGGIGGVCSVLVGHPMDTVKVRLQTMPKPAPGEPPFYTGTLDCIKKTIQKEGPIGLYSGMGAPLISVTPIYALSFFGFAVGKKVQISDPTAQLTSGQLFKAGTISVFFVLPITVPAERVKCLLQVQQHAQVKLYSGALDCAVKLLKTGGIQSLYRGTIATLMRDIPATGTYFTTYEVFRKSLTPEGQEPSLLAAVLSGGVAGTLNWLIALPIDVLKSVYQTAPDGKYRGIRDVFKQVMKTDGIGGLFRGVIPVMLRAFPANAATFLGFEISIDLMSKLHGK